VLDRLVEPDPLQRLLLDVADGAAIGQPLRLDGHSPPAVSAAAAVDRPSARDRERQTDEGALVPAETLESPDEVDPGIGREVLRLLCLEDTEVPQHARVHESVEHDERVGIARPRGVQGVVERVPVRHDAGAYSRSAAPGIGPSA
jgi:hypothetical protein